jgi:hypothetical protein
VEEPGHARDRGGTDWGMEAVARRLDRTWAGAAGRPGRGGARGGAGCRGGGGVEELTMSGCWRTSGRASGTRWLGAVQRASGQARCKRVGGQARAEAGRRIREAQGPGGAHERRCTRAEAGRWRAQAEAERRCVGEAPGARQRERAEARRGRGSRQVGSKRLWEARGVSHI